MKALALFIAACARIQPGCWFRATLFAALCHKFVRPDSAVSDMRRLATAVFPAVPDISAKHLPTILRGVVLMGTFGILTYMAVLRTLRLRSLQRGGQQRIRPACRPELDSLVNNCFVSGCFLFKAIQKWVRFQLRTQYPAEQAWET